MYRKPIMNKHHVKQNSIFTKRLISTVIALTFVTHTPHIYAQAPDPTNADQTPQAASVPSAQTPTLVLQSPVSVIPAESIPTALVVTPSNPMTTGSVSAVSVPSAPAGPRRLPVVYSHLGADQSNTKIIMDDLRVVHLSAMQKNVGTQVALNVAMLLLGGGIGFRGVDKNDFSGSPPDDVKDASRLKNPALVQLVQEVERQSSDWLASNPKTSELNFVKPLVISSASWRLVYNSLSSDDKTYQLKFDVDVYKIRDKKAFFSNPSSTGKGCRFASNARHIDEWKANDYQAVVDMAPMAIAQCAKEFTAQLTDLLDLK